MKFCQNCGKKIPSDATFCSYCGAKQDDVQQPQQNIHQRQNIQHIQPQPRRTEYHSSNNVNDADYWYTHGFFTSIIQSRFIFRFMWAALFGLIGMAVFTVPALKSMGQSLAEMKFLMIIGLIVGLFLFIIPLNRHWLIAMNRWLTIKCYRFMHNRHPEYSKVDIDRIVNYRIKKFDAIAWKTISILCLIVIGYFLLELVFCILVFGVILWLLGAAFGGPHWHIFPSHWY